MAVTKSKKVDKEQIDGDIKKSTKTKSPATSKTKEVAQKLVETSETTEDKTKSSEQKIAKAGKRSAKSLAEIDEKVAKEARKTSKDDTPEPDVKAKLQQKPARTRLERRGKKFREVAKLIDKSKDYSLKEAIELAQKTSTTKFDATVEVHISLNVDPKHADQNIRGTVSLPAGTGKKVRVAVFADTDDVKKAKDAGADIAGSEEFLQLLDKEEINFDILIATPLMMAKLGKYARVLGPKGLMPNPKSGTVTTDVAKAVKEAQAGKIEYRIDSAGIIHVGAGKVSFTAGDILKNIETILASIKNAKPASVKSTYLKSLNLSTSMGPGIHVSANEF